MSRKMNLDDSNESSNIDLVELANTILAALNYSSQISEEDLYSDEYYILVFTALTSDEDEINLEPGKTQEEKIENLKLILAALSQLFNDKILEIDVKKIIMKKDKENATKFVEALYIMIQMLAQNMKLEEEKGEGILGDLGEEVKSHSFNDNRMNLSEKKETEKMRRNKDEEINLENLESLRLGKDKDKKKEKKEEKKEKDEESEEKDENNNKESEIEIKDSNDVKKSGNKKKDEEEKEISIERENILNSEKKEKEEEEDKIDNDNVDNLQNSSKKKEKKENIVDSERESGKKKSNEIPNLLDEEEGNNEINIIQKAKNQLEEMRLSEQESSDSRFNNTEKRKAHSVSQSLPKLYNPNPEDDNDMDIENYMENEDNDLDYDYNQNKKSKKSESGSNSNINIDNSSKKKSNDNINDDNDDDYEENSKSIPQSSQKKKDTKKSTSNKKKEKTSTNKKSSNKKEIQKSKKEQSDKKGENEKEKEEVMESGQKEVNANEVEPEQKNSQVQDEENYIENEEPTLEEEYRYEIMKQFRKIYGDKLDNIFLKYNMQNSRNVFELVLRNIKLAKQKMLKIENRLPEVDDLKTKEYILRYERERQMMEANYNKEQKRINFFEERAINNFKQNMKDAKKTKEIAARKTENEIERRRKAQEVRNYHNQVKFCNEIYQRALELEKEKKIEKMKKKREENRIENEEKRLAMERIENYYKDQIKILREVLDNEKKQKEIEHRAHIQFLSTFAKERRNEYRKELDNIFDRFEQEERKNEFERKNKKELNKIFDSYYGK